jgi:tape measure domain-containing protein
MKPLDEARARAAVAAAAGPSSDGADPAFIAFLRQHLVTGDIKAQEWPQLSTISQMKVRWQYLAKAIQFLEGWKKPRGGYRVPTSKCHLFLITSAF